MVMHVHFSWISPSISFHFLIKCHLHEYFSTHDDYCVVHLLKLMMQGICKVENFLHFLKLKARTLLGTECKFLN